MNQPDLNRKAGFQQIFLRFLLGILAVITDNETHKAPAVLLRMSDRIKVHSRDDARR
jgi:hypothetical protein